MKIKITREEIMVQRPNTGEEQIRCVLYKKGVLSPFLIMGMEGSLSNDSLVVTIKDNQ